MARDQGMVPYMDFGTVEVKVLDVNDKAPVFETVSKRLHIIPRVEIILTWFALKIQNTFH